jgi:hypothetical protein
LSVYLLPCAQQDPTIDLFKTWETALAYSDSSDDESEGEAPRDASLSPVKVPQEATLDEADALAEAFGCSRKMAIAVDKVAKFWWRRARLRMDLRRIQVGLVQ